MKAGYGVGLLLIVSAQACPANARQEMQAEYRQQGVQEANPEAGEILWKGKHMPKQNTAQRSCTTCHGNNPKDQGKHVRTGKPISPMAVSVNPQRFSEAKKIRKWFKRNCKWTLGRECSAQEQADILAYLSSQ
jgi:hypothetical protein